MTGKLARLERRFTIIVIILVTMSLGCLCLPKQITPTVPPVTQPIAPIIPDPPVVEPPIHRTPPLASEGPWLLMETYGGLWAANPDGSGVTQFTDVDYWEGDLQRAVQPQGNLVVFLSPANYDLHNMTLNLISLPDGTITKITDLSSPETEAFADLTPGDDGLEAMRAVREQVTYTWSPDGTRLAFVGLMDGPSAEIYIYNTITGGITRVNDDNAQNYWPSWSPDGNTLIYFGAESFGVGAGFETTGAWLASGIGTEVSVLYTPTGGVEEVVGWLDNTTVVLDSWHSPTSGWNLRLFDIVTTNTVILSEDGYFAAVDSWRGTAMFANSSGLYLLTTEDYTPVLVSEESVAQIEPMDLGERLFTVFFDDGSLATFGTGEFDHQVSPFSSPTWGLDVAEYGVIWGWTNEDDYHPGAWITGPGVEIGQIYTGPARLPIWDQHNNLLFFADSEGGGYDLYRTTFDAYYSDLEVVGHIDTPVISVAWLGTE